MVSSIVRLNFYADLSTTNITLLFEAIFLESELEKDSMVLEVVFDYLRRGLELSVKVRIT